MKDNHPNELFSLETITDNPLFEGFGMEDAPSVLGRARLRDDMSPGPGPSETTRLWQPSHFSTVWSPPKVKGRVAWYHDFPSIDLVLPAFSYRAVDALRAFLQPNGELLPLNSEVGRYYFYNITTIVDALDIENSECDFFPDRPWLAFDANYFAFHEERLAGLSIFRLVDLPAFTIVSDAFVDRVRECALQGFHFEKIWPFPRGLSWRTEARMMKKLEERKRG